MLIAAGVAVFCAASAAYCARVAMRHVEFHARWRRAVGLLEQLDAELTATYERLRIADTEATRLVEILERERGVLVETQLENARQIDGRAAQVYVLRQEIQREIIAKRERKRTIIEGYLDTIMARRGE